MRYLVNIWHIAGFMAKALIIQGDSSMHSLIYRSDSTLKNMQKIRINIGSERELNVEFFLLTQGVTVLHSSFTQASVF